MRRPGHADAGAPAALPRLRRAGADRRPAFPLCPSPGGCGTLPCSREKLREGIVLVRREGENAAAVARWHHLGFAFVWALTFAGLAVPDGFAGQRPVQLERSAVRPGGRGRRRALRAAAHALPAAIRPDGGRAAGRRFGRLLPGGQRYRARPARARWRPASGGPGPGLVLRAVAAVLRLRGGIAHGPCSPGISALLSVALSVLLALLPDAARALCSRGRPARCGRRVARPLPCGRSCPPTPVRA